MDALTSVLDFENSDFGQYLVVAGLVVCQVELVMNTGKIREASVNQVGLWSVCGFKLLVLNPY